MSIEQLDHIHLIGNPAENFYALGKRDKNAFTEVHTQISRLCLRNDFMAKVLKTTSELTTKFSKKYQGSKIDEIKSYAQGLERPFEDVLFTMLMPEMVASFNKWAPDLLSLVPGCSSLFLWDKKNQGVVHTRILDYALSGPFEKFERSVLYDFKDRYKVYSYGSAGFALPGLTAMNDQGLTLALHYKHGQYFDLEGESIFFIASDILSQCTSTREAIKMLRAKQSISFWGLYMSDKEGEVASVDICGKEIHQEKFDIKDHSYLYFNNRALLKKPEYEKMQPYGNFNQCLMRTQSLKKRIDNYELEKSEDLMLSSLEIMGKPSSKKVKGSSKWLLPTTTPSSIQLCSFHNNLNNAYFVKGPAPKLFNGNYIKQTLIFSDIKSESKSKKVTNSKYLKGHQFLSQFQSQLDKNEITEAYHALQMSILLLKGYEEDSILKFYLYILEYIYEADKRDLSFLYQDFQSLEGKLPPYLNDHRLLFLLRTSKLLNQTVENQIQLVENQGLKEMYRKEFNLNAMAIKGLKFLIYPRIEILDIIYAY
jgi:hypothetical protein